MIRNFTALCLALVALLCTPAFAQDIAKPVAAAESAAPAPADAARPGMVTTVPTRESLVAFFEQQMKNDPQVKDFTKRADGDYDFQTGFFPYTGRLKLLNAAVTADS
ncbi:MAG TPA: hypothetical protein VEF76_07375, partial [Patescibacteria group bacterium]|nr:hypothetical protein [Patescibacteria group bacterium]